ncbi:CRTAC1 family protein [Schlesneria sp. T3-172]|uniref:CRTAC1 family protein n=1 Tax=Schlesneria sphaerica TaxID=3373610 RepID=UPI0037CAE545
MSQSLKQIVITVLFLGMLGWVAFRGSEGNRSQPWARLTGNASPSAATLEEAEALRRYGFCLTEAAEQVGISFRHAAAELDPKLSHIMPIVNAMGAAATVFDFDNDRYDDLYVVSSKAGSQNALYRNRGDGTFEDVASSLGVADLNQPGTGASMGSLAADYDNDGYVDLFVYKWGRPELFRNNEGKGFVRVTEGSGLPAWVNANAACWFDYDRDGRLDLFLAGYWSEEVDLWNLKTTQIMPESFEYARNGGRKYLLRNLGDGKFQDVTSEMGIQSTRWTLGVVAADICGTGYPDLILANDYGVSEFYANREGKRFEEIGYETGIGVTPKSGMSVGLGDIFNDGQQALYITNITEPGNLVQGNNLWVPTGESTRGAPRFLNQASAVNVERGGWSWGAKFGDLNNDGWLDLYLTNGYISASKGKSYWYDYGKIAGGLKGLIGEATYWPPIGEQSLSGYQPKCVWLNKGGDFTDIAAAVGVTDVYDGRAVVFSDFSNRGILDVAIANQQGPVLFYRNTISPGRDWVQFHLEGGARPGNEQGWSNRGGVGATVTLHWVQGQEGTTRQQSQVTTAGDAYASQSMSRVHFGLGEQAKLKEVRIKWPSGRTTQIDAPETGVVHLVREIDSKEAAK